MASKTIPNRRNSKMTTNQSISTLASQAVELVRQGEEPNQAINEVSIAAGADSSQIQKIASEVREEITKPLPVTQPLD
jgi:hypothetical protein